MSRDIAEPSYFLFLEKHQVFHTVQSSFSKLSPIITTMNAGSVLLCCTLWATSSCRAFILPGSHRHVHVRGPGRRLPTPSSSISPSSTCLMSHDKSSDVDMPLQTKQNHPDAICWSTTLEQSPNSYVHPSVELAIRPLEEGGTGIIAIDDIPDNTTVISLAVDEVPVIDAATIIDAYKKHPLQDDEIMKMLVKIWHGIGSIKTTVNTAEVFEIEKEKTDINDVLVGIIAHLQLTRCRDLSGSTQLKEGFALDESRRLGLFLDSMPLLPRNPTPDKHPNPSNFIFWKDKEVKYLLNNTIADNWCHNAKASLSSRVKAWSRPFLAAYPDYSFTDIINAIASSIACINSRAFGRDAYKKHATDRVKKDMHVLVPLADKMNHMGEYSNVDWDSPLLIEEDEDYMRKEGERINFEIKSHRDIKKGEELTTSYGANRADWDYAAMYGFVPSLNQTRQAFSAIPVFPMQLELDPNTGIKYDLRQRENVRPLIKAMTTAYDAAMKGKPASEIIKPKFHYIILPYETTVRWWPMIEVPTRISNEMNDTIIRSHKASVYAILPFFRAAASITSQLQYNYQNNVKAPLSLKKMVAAVNLKDTETDWNKKGLQLMCDQIDHRLDVLRESERVAKDWFERVNVHYNEEREIRYNLAKDLRDSEMKVLESLLAVAQEWDGSLAT